MPVADLARDNPVTARPDTSLADIAATMRDEQIGSVVIEDDGKPVGIVTDRDLAVRSIAEGADATSQTVADVMTEDPICIECTAGVLELTDVMREHSIRRVPVTEDGELVGIITQDDLSRLFADEQQHLAEVVEAESPPY